MQAWMLCLQKPPDILSLGSVHFLSSRQQQRRTQQRDEPLTPPLFLCPSKENSTMNNIRFVTSCGHEVTSKSVRGGSQWISRIVGPKATGKSGAKTVYSEPNLQSVKERVAKFLEILPSGVVTRGIGGVYAKSALSKRAAARGVPRPMAASAPKKRASTTHTRPFTTTPQTQTQEGPNILTIRSNLREALREMRDSHAKSKGVPPHYVFDNQILNAIVAYLPSNHDELSAIRGLGAMKVLEYGPMVFEVIRNHLQSLYGILEGNVVSKRRRVVVHV